jgi:polyisoprenoid-binding protein YceI
MIIRQLLFSTLALLVSSQALATWNLNNEKSSLSFVSIKAVDIAEVHRFKEMAGRISDKGKAVVTIELASVDTGVPIRDERMQEMLFETGKYPLATARAKLDMKIVDAVAPGNSTQLTTELELDLHGVRVTVDANVVIAMLDEKALMVTSSKPVILNAASVNLVDGIEALREVASLPSIGNAVPVSFVLVFEKSD